MVILSRSRPLEFSQRRRIYSLSVFTVSQINIFPIKSAKGISLSSADVGPRGFLFDRQWMVVDEEKRFCTQRELPRLALITVRLTDGGLTLNAPGMEMLTVHAMPAKGKTVRVLVWKDTLDALEADEGINNWFREFLGIECSLVMLAVSSDRVASRMSVSSQVSFADGYPFMLLSEGSLEDLNSRLVVALPMNRFRPNIVVRGCEPYAEDTWRAIRIGSLRFYVVKPCERCPITTVDQDRGMRDGKEPLKTLAGFRQRDGAILFGQNLIHEGTGILHVGDGVEVEQFIG